MADEPKFNHIIVDAEEDEVVIQAGSLPQRGAPAKGGADREADSADGAPAAQFRGEASAASSGEPGGSAEESAPAASGEAGKGFGPDDALLEKVGLGQDDISDEARREYEQHARKAAMRQEAATMVTTEEDLHAKMPFVNMQRVIAIVLLLLIAAFAFYWFATHSLVG